MNETLGYFCMLVNGNAANFCGVILIFGGGMVTMCNNEHGTTDLAWIACTF